VGAHILVQYCLEQMVSTKVASLALGVTTKTVVAWIEAGSLEGGKVGHRWLVLLSAVHSIQQRARDKSWASSKGSGGSKIMADKAMEQLDAIFNRRCN
jgi:hypothetical protein